MYQHFLHGVPTSLIPRLHGAATALETALRTWCPGLRFPAAAGTTASAMGDGCCCCCGCATPSSLLGAALHGDGGDNADTVCMHASSQRRHCVHARLVSRSVGAVACGQRKRLNEAWGSVCIYVRFRMVGWRPARESCCCWAPAASVHRAAVAPHLLPCWFVRHGWCS